MRWRRGGMMGESNNIHIYSFGSYLGWEPPSKLRCEGCCWAGKSWCVPVRIGNTDGASCDQGGVGTPQVGLYWKVPTSLLCPGPTSVTVIFRKFEGTQDVYKPPMNAKWIVGPTCVYPFLNACMCIYKCRGTSALPVSYVWCSHVSYFRWY